MTDKDKLSLISSATIDYDYMSIGPTSRFWFEWYRNLWPSYDGMMIRYFDDDLTTEKSIVLDKGNFKTFLDTMPGVTDVQLALNDSSSQLVIHQTYIVESEPKRVSIGWKISSLPIEKLIGKAGLVYCDPSDIYDSLIHTFEQEGLV